MSIVQFLQTVSGDLINRLRKQLAEVDTESSLISDIVELQDPAVISNIKRLTSQLALAKREYAGA